MLGLTILSFLLCLNDPLAGLWEPAQVSCIDYSPDLQPTSSGPRCSQKSAPPCVYATLKPSMGEYMLFAFYKAAKCISLVQHVSVNSATDSGKNELEVPLLAGKKMDPSCGKAVGTGGYGMLHKWG